MAKRKVGVKLAIWLPNAKSRELTTDFLACRWCATYRWKPFDEGYNFAWDFIAIRGLHRKLCTLKVTGVLAVGIFETPTWKSRDKKSFGCVPRGELHSILWGGRWWLPSSLGYGVSCEFELPVARPGTKSASTMH